MISEIWILQRILKYIWMVNFGFRIVDFVEAIEI